MIGKVFFYFYKRLLGNVAFAKKIGVKVGYGCRILGKVNFGSEPYLIKLGNRVSVTDSTFATHDGGVWVFREEHPSVDVIAPITVGDNVFIGTGCIILPGVNIENDVVVGAGSVVSKDLKKGGVYAGVPAIFIKSIEEYKGSCLESSIPTKEMQNKENFLRSKFNV